MTDLNKLLYVAEKVWPEYAFLIDKNAGDVLGVKKNPYDAMIVEPHKPTERGKAQLMDIVFATYKKIGMRVGDANTYNERTGKLLDGLILEDRGILINLAAEVL